MLFFLPMFSMLIQFLAPFWVNTLTMSWCPVTKRMIWFNKWFTFWWFQCEVVTMSNCNLQCGFAVLWSFASVGSFFKQYISNFTSSYNFIIVFYILIFYLNLKCSDGCKCNNNQIPYNAAIISGVMPFLVVAFTSAHLSTSRWAIALFPPTAAACRTVVPSFATILISPHLPKSCSKIFSLPM